MPYMLNHVGICVGGGGGGGGGGSGDRGFSSVHSISENTFSNLSITIIILETVKL